VAGLACELGTYYSILNLRWCEFPVGFFLV
jgi:hypothetical protein